ncbi:MAG: deoxyribonuclease IV [Actinomycetota bacterium]
MKVGAHLRRQGRVGIHGALEGTQERGADCAQLFISNARGWVGPRVSDEDAGTFRRSWEQAGLGPVVAHAPYLVNIASPNPEFLRKSRELAVATAQACDRLGISVLVVHAGAGGPGGPAEAVTRAAETLRIAADAADHVRVSVELMAGTAGAVASFLPEAARLFDAADEDRIGLVLDTCHLFAAGYTLDTAEGAVALVDELAANGLTDRLALIHANDSKFERGARRDRHENIGDGAIGETGWRALLGQPVLTSVPLILETPADAERHAQDIATLRAWAADGSSDS